MSDPAHVQRLAAYVGPNADYYLRKWAELERGGSMSWNFAAFFLGPFWLAYRRMLVPALIVVALFFGIFLLETLGRVEGASLFSALISLGVGLYGNRMYRNQAERAAAVSGGDPARLQLAGGVSMPMAIGLAVAFVVLVGLALKLMQEADAGPFERRSSYRPYGGGAPPPVPSLAPTMADSTITQSWLLGRWGTIVSNCGTYMILGANGLLSDDGGNTGTWSFNVATQQFTMTMGGQSYVVQATRRGETLILAGSAASREWRRCS